jgi:2-phosphosulfolactate phosphatase
MAAGEDEPPVARVLPKRVMNIRIVEGIQGAREATGAVVVIDVMRAFTTAAYAFHAGISEIELVASIDEALALPGFRMGEEGGRMIAGFDHNNSPSGLIGRRLEGRGVQRTGAGTRCVSELGDVEEIWLGSLVVASATVRALAGRREITLVVSGAPHEGEEDLACAELMAAALEGVDHSHADVVEAVMNSRAAARHRASDDHDFPLADLECAVSIDAFPFAMKVELEGGRKIARPYAR